MNTPLCSIIILSYNQLPYTQKCLDSIFLYTNDVSYEIIVIDNASNTETVSYLKKVPGIHLVLNKENLGFAGGCNQGISMACGKYILLLNNDTIVTKRWLYHMVQLLEKREDIAMTGPLTNATVGKQRIEVPYSADNLEEMQRFASKIAEGKGKPWRTLRLVAFCVLIRRELFEEIGALDSGFSIGNYEDDDFNIRALCAGKKAYICRNSFVHHFMNISFHQKEIEREKIMERNKRYLEQKWGQMNWNHHAEYNKCMLQWVLKKGGGRLLHIGCGLGALEIELKDSGQKWYIEGMDNHPIREKIASEFIDTLYPYRREELEKLNGIYDIIVIECSIEKWGIEILEKLKRLLRENGRIIVRVFNVKHITTLERVVTGKLEGDLLCAVAKEFKYYYDDTIEEKIEKAGYRIEKKQEIKKSFSHLQEKLFEAVKDYLPNEGIVVVYNRIYYLRLNT